MIKTGYYKMQSTRNYSVDTLKFICAVLIVLLHVKTPWQEYVLPVTRCAVPLFFMISGYFLYESESMANRLIRALKKTFHLFLWSTLLFAFIKIGQSWHSGNWNFLTLRALMKFIIFNENPFGFHLWYISAYLYVLVITLVVDKYNLWRISYFVIPILLLTDLAFGKYSILLWGHDYPFILVRNFMCVGLPYFLLGALIKRHNENILKIKPILTISGGVLTIVTSLAEHSVLVYYGLNASRDHYISSTPLAVCIFISALLIKQEKQSFFSKLGERDSLYIYVLHPIMMLLIPFINKTIGCPLWNEYLYPYIAPFVILCFTILLIYSLRRVNIIR